MTPSNANTSGMAPCPFCAGAPSVRQAMGETWVVCGSCSASTQLKGRETVAFDLWNRRVTAASAQAEREARLAAEARADRLASAMTDLVSWFDKPVQGERGMVWVIRAGDLGADDAVAESRAALQQEG